MVTAELRSFLQRVEDPYIVVRSTDEVSATVTMEPVLRGKGPVGVMVNVDEFYKGGNRYHPTENEELSDVTRIGIVWEPNGETTVKMAMESGYQGKIEVAEVR